MTNLHKAFWHSEDNSIKLSMPIAKVDKEKRTVSGFATLDNIDKQADIVPTDVSIQAFERFRGNLREMHMPIAVGRVISFKSDKFYNKEEDKFYNGVFVNAYISKGAQDTWEKVLDGTLSGFSIGGSIKESEEMYDAQMDKAIRVIKEYDLHELSLVDNPANQFANIVSIEKIADGTNRIDGIISKVDLENVYWCESDSLVRVSQEEDSACPSCEKHMINIGFVESNDTEKNSVIKGLLKSQKIGLGNKITKAENPNKEGNNMAEENVEVAPATEEVVETPAADAPAVTEEVAAEVPAAEEVATEENIEKSDSAQEAPAEVPAADAPAEAADAPAEVAEDAPVEDTATPAEDSEDAELAKAVDTVQESIDEVQNTVASALGDLVATVKSLNQKMAELQKSIASTKEEIVGVKSNVEEFGKRVDSLEDDTAIRKSGDLGGVVQETQIRKGSMWGGRFLNSADLYR